MNAFWVGIHDNIHGAFVEAVPEQTLENTLHTDDVELWTLEQKHGHLKSLVERELEARRRNGDNSDSVGRQVHVIGMLQSELGDYSASQATWHHLLVNNHPSRPNLSALYNLAYSFEEQQKHVEAEGMLRAITPLLQWKIGEASPQVLGCIRMLARCIYNQGRADEAKETLELAR